MCIQLNTAYMKKIFTLLLGLLCFASFGTHSMGGVISWENVGPSTFVFRMTRIVGCIGDFPPTTATLDGPQGTISMQLVTYGGNTATCQYPSYYCMGIVSPATVAYYIYESDPITLLGIPPLSGWEFSIPSGVMCCGSQAANMQVPSSSELEISSTMYPETVTLGLSSPSFVESYDQSITAFNHTIANRVYAAQPGDSLFFKRSKPSLGAGASTSFAQYNVGFDYQNPFPDTSESSQNGPIDFNSQTGMFYVKAKSGVTGYYGYRVTVEQWHMVDDGQKYVPVKVSKIRRDYQVPLNVEDTSNTAPVAWIDTAMYPQVSQVAASDYIVSASVGDTVRFNIHSTDSDVDTNFLPQQITFDAKGAALDSSWGGWELYSSIPDIVPMQQGFTSLASNSVEFEWYISSDLVDTSNAYHAFSFSFTDNNCDYKGRSSIGVIVKVKGPDTTASSGVGVRELDSKSIEIYPNPVSEKFVINGLAGGTTIELLDIQGRVIETHHFTEKSAELKRNNLPSGVYFVKIEDSNTTTIKKVFFK